MKQPANGFTLIELLIAMAIMAIALTALAGSTTVATHNNIRLQEKTVALWVAQDVISQFRVTNSWPTGNTRGENNQMGQVWPWEIEVSQSSAENLFKIDVSVFPPGEDASPAATLSSFYTVYTRSRKQFSGYP